MIACYLDDSGKESDPSGQFVCMAGYLAHDSYWGRFSGDWLHQLLRHKISCVHMKYLIPMQGEYKNLGWEATKRNEVLSDFIRVIKDDQLIGFGVSVDAVAWRRLVPQEIRKTEGDAHQFCFARMARMLIKRMECSAPNDFLAIIFDTDSDFGSRRFSLFSKIWGNDPIARKYLASISFADMKKHSPLQAADILAWETRKELVQKVGGYNSTPRYEDLFTALPGKPLDYESELWDEDEIKTKLVSSALPEDKEHA